MSTAQILLLGAIAGSTIFIGLPIGRVQNCSLALKATLSAAATGILLFLFFDVLEHGVGPVEDSLNAAVHTGGSWAIRRLRRAARRRLRRRLPRPRPLRPLDAKRQRAKSLLGPGAASAAEFEPSCLAAMSSAAGWPS